MKGDILNPGHLDHPLEVGREDPVSDEPAGQLGPLGGVAAVDGQTRLRILVLSILQVAGYFLGHNTVKSSRAATISRLLDPQKNYQIKL